MRKIIDVAAGDHHSLLLDEDGRVWAMGDNASHQLGALDAPCNHVPRLVDIMLCVDVDDEGNEVYADVQVKSISAGARCSFAIDTEGNGAPPYEEID